MKKVLMMFMAIILSVSLVYSVPVNAATDLNYTSKVITESGNFAKNIEKKSYKRIIRTYKELKKLKKEISKKYNNPKKYLKQLNKYKKSYFKKNALVFVTETMDVNHKSYELKRATKYNNKLRLHINQYYNVPEGVGITCAIVDASKTYFINIKKSKIKKVTKIKVKYTSVNE